jgi:TPP-dependent pyruvate/acetoin dehydrogenase alpha subunit
MGQEAISVGVCHTLKPEDQVFATYRNHAAFLAKTEDTDMFFAELYGRTTGTAQGKSGSMHLAVPNKGYMSSSGIVGSCIPLAVGAAFANKYVRNNHVACVFLGDGALDAGVFWESFNVACVMRLPVLFVVEDNGYAVNTPVHARQGFKGITDVMNKFECYLVEETTTDVEVIYRFTLNSIESIKATEKPSLLHLKCYRYLEHVGINEDFHAGYRPRSEYLEWYKRDCLVLQRNRLLSIGYAETDIEEVERLIDEQIKNSVARATEAPFPEPEELYRGVFYDNDLL